MYEQRFGFRRRPFPATPDASCYYPSSIHEAALTQLLQALTANEGLALLTGPPGSGKTLLCHCLLERAPEGTASAFLTNTHCADRSALLQSILFDLSLPYEEGTEQHLRLRLTDHLLKTAAEDRRTLLVVDEAHLLSSDLLEELRLLGNLEVGKQKAIQSVLIGQDDLSTTLARPELASLNQRIVARPVLQPLGLEEAVDYLLHHLRAAGAKPESFIDETSLEILARGGRGVPRLLNQAGNQALTLAHAAEMNHVDSEAAFEALALLGLESSEGAETESHDTTELALVADDGPRAFDAPRRA